MTEEVQDNIEVRPIDEAPTVDEKPSDEDVPIAVDAPKPKGKAKAKPRAKKAALPPPPPAPLELERQETNVEMVGEGEPAVKKRQTRRKSAKTPPAEEETITSITPEPIAYPTSQQIAMYLQNQKLLKMQKRQSKVQQLVAAAF